MKFKSLIVNYSLNFPSVLLFDLTVHWCLVLGILIGICLIYCSVVYMLTQNSQVARLSYKNIYILNGSCFTCTLLFLCSSLSIRSALSLVRSESIVQIYACFTHRFIFASSTFLCGKSCCGFCLMFLLCL